MQICPLNPRSGDTSAAGLLTHGSTPFGAFPPFRGRTVTGLRLTVPKVGTMTGVRRAEGFPNYSGGPVPDFHRLPYSPQLRGTTRYSVSATKNRICWMQSQ